MQSIRLDASKDSLNTRGQPPWLDPSETLVVWNTVRPQPVNDKLCAVMLLFASAKSFIVSGCNDVNLMASLGKAGRESFRKTSSAINVRCEGISCQNNL